MLRESSIPAGCEIVDSFEVHATSRIKSFYELSANSKVPEEVNVALYNDNETRKYRQMVAKLKDGEYREKYFEKYPDRTSLPIDYEDILIVQRYEDKAINFYYGLLLSCENSDSPHNKAPK